MFTKPKTCSKFGFLIHSYIYIHDLLNNFSFDVFQLHKLDIKYG